MSPSFCSRFTARSISERGAVVAEYALLLALVAVVIAVVIGGLTGGIINTFQAIIDVLS